MGAPEREEKEKGTKDILEKKHWLKISAKLMSDTKPQFQEAQRTQNRINANKQKPTPRQDI